MSVQYPIRAAAKLTGISVDTLRAWERRYKAVTPGRSARGRLYDDSDIRRLLLLRSAVDSGRAIGQVACLSDAELEELESKARSFRGQYQPTAALLPAEPALQPLLDSIASFDYGRANEELGRLAVLLGPAGLVRQVILPVMQLAGEYWEKGVFQVAQEHMLSACVRNVLGGLIRHRTSGNGAVRLVLTTPAGELHEFGILAAAILAVGHGVQISYLGPNLPWREILFAVEKGAPHAVVLGIVNTNARSEIRAELNMLASALPTEAELWVGGSGAAKVFDGISRDGSFLLENIADFERHLARLRAASSLEAVR